ncbi:conserved hypothetical protein [Cupriavidus necator]|uniref:SMODS-associated and fused to various effectors domain-containing protein n=1 Tax=Cupriavidus necator TaxID=106590 RepID=A0A1K0IF72_CUPNE|nr:conserved hypothetical protein [Cupriavidus necator]
MADMLPSPLNGEDFARVIGRLEGESTEILVVVNGFTACVYQRRTPADAWLPVCRGELSEHIESVISATLRRRMWWAQVDGSAAAADPASLDIERLTMKTLRKWLRSADDVTGREGEVTQSTRERVAYLAAWRCQFAGCGTDLHTHAPTGRSGRFSYYAHLVASSPRGPRGHAARSARLANEVENIMLLCDACHRLVDRIDPDYYTEELLQGMRRRSIADVKRLLNTLQYPPVEVIAIVGSIAGQVPQFSIHDAEPALWESHLRAANHQPEYLFHIDHQLHDVHASDYWSAVFRALKSDGSQLQRILNGAGRGGAPRPRIAIFPQHSTSVLLVAGRVLGDTGGTYLFQPHRSVAADPKGTRWVWPQRERAHRCDKFLLRVHKTAEPGAREANLMVSLTFGIAPRRLPPGCFDAASNTLGLPTVEVYVEPQDRGIHLIGAPEDLQELGRTLDRAIQILHDEWHVSRVNLFIGAPATAVVTMGQKMQARNQATYVCHESKEYDGVFLPTVEISSTQVLEPKSGQVFELQP